MESVYGVFIQSSTIQLRISELGLWIENDTGHDAVPKIRNPQSTIHN